MHEKVFEDPGEDFDRYRAVHLPNTLDRKFCLYLAS